MQLIRYEAARQALTEANSVDEAKDWSDKAAAMQAYARQANDSGLERMAAEIRLRAKRRIGEISASLESAQGTNQYVELRPAAGTKRDVLSDVGLSKSEAHRCEQLAKVPEDQFEGYLAECRDDKRVASSDAVTSHFIREQRRDQNSARLSVVKGKSVVVPNGLYDVIVIDPPWPMKKIERDVRPNQSDFDYPTMTEEDLRKLALPANKNCHAWVWTTHKFMPMALRLLEAWSLRYVCNFVWHKSGGFQPINLPQYNCEFALYARRGVPSFIDTKAFNVCFSAPRTKHSEKPQEFYDVVKRVTAGRRLDMFARREIEGFDGYGNEYEALAS